MDFSHIDFEQLEMKVLGDLEKELPSYLTYHSVQHTKNVINDAMEIATHENVSPPNIMKIKIAALLHDTGFMMTYQNHEEASCAYAKKVLPKYKISTEDLVHICEMIMATKIPQRPKDQCGKILADADLAYLGTEHFGKISSLLFDELKHMNPMFDLQTWNQIQIKFLTNHQYFTNYCIANKAVIKDIHLQNLISDI
ncbi:MAG TPA: HD domain-containing protein [Saprospiraceae bacterium]|nr:HD domain-containing protein [Saprospiraceae bacterium]